MGAISKAVRILVAAAPTFPRPRRRLLGPTRSAREVVGDLVEHLGLETVRRDELSAVLGATDALLVSSDNDVRALVTTGLLEDLLLLASYPDAALDLPTLGTLLPPRCASTVRELDELWTAIWISQREAPPALGLDDYLGIDNVKLRSHFRRSHRPMPDGRLVGIADVLRWEADPPVVATEQGAPRNAPSGHSVAGRRPRRVGTDGRTATSSTDPSR